MPVGQIFKGASPWFSNGIRRKNAIVASTSAAVTLKPGQSGQRFALDRASGTSYTLPAPVKGLTYEFVVTVLQTSGNNVITTNVGSVFLLGAIQAFSGEAVAPSATLGPFQFAANGSSHVKFQSNGTTTGGGIGSTFKVTCISSTQWLIEGTSKSPSGNMATPFA
jgi:hypothetical protein